MQLVRLYLDDEPGELIGIALLNDAREAGRGGLFRLPEFEAPRHLAEVQFLINICRARRIVLLEEAKEAGTVTAVEGIEPG